MRKIRVSHPTIGDFSFAVTNKGVVVGRRGGGADIDLGWDALVSRRHGRFWTENGEVQYEDLGSRNGSYLQFKRIQEAKLALGASVLLGETTFRVEEGRPDENPEQTAAFEVRAAELQGELVVSDLTLEATSLETVSAPAAMLPKRSRPTMPPKPPDTAKPRFIGSGQVKVEVTSPTQLEILWREQFSKGALFVPSEAPPPANTAIQIFLEAPHGELTLRATIVHVLDTEHAKQIGYEPGAGLQLTDLTADKKKAIERYVSGESSELST